MSNYSFYNENFDIKQIMESGQFFNYEKINDTYKFVVNGEYVEITTKDHITTINKSKEFFDTFLFDFFDMGVDYGVIINEIKKDFPELSEYVEYSKGVRLIKQELLPVCIFFILSQRNNMRNIKRIVNLLVEKYGENGKFPCLTKLKELKQEDFKEIGAGFRDKYLFNFIQKIDDNWLNEMYLKSSDDAFVELISFLGIGPKVANCIILFGLHKRDVFPVDTHIQAIMQRIYFIGTGIEEYAKDRFKDKASYIQQYLFYYDVMH